MTNPISNYEQVYIRARIIDMAKAANNAPSIGVAGSIQLTPSIKPGRLVSPALRMIIAAGTFKITLDPVTGVGYAPVYATDDPDIDATGWTYRVTEPGTGAVYDLPVPKDTPILDSPGDPLDGKRVLDLSTAQYASSPSPGFFQVIPARGVTSIDIVSGQFVATYTDGATQVIGDVPTGGTGGAPSGAAGGALGGTYPNPTFAVDMATQAELDAHASSTSNPHSVTKAQVGLGSVDDVSAANLRDRSTHTGTQSVSTVTGLAAVATSGAYADLTGRPPLARTWAADLILFVSPSGSDANDGLSWQTAKATLPAAITALSTGGCIEIAGTHTIGAALPTIPDNTLIRGRGPTTRLVFSTSGVLCTLTNASQIHFADLRVSLSSAFGQAFEVDTTFRCSWQNVIIDGLHNTGTGTTYHGQVGIAFRGNAGDNRMIGCDLNNLGEAIQSSTIMNYVIGSNIGSCWRGLHIDAGSNAGGMTVTDCTFQGTSIGAAQVEAHVLVDVNANKLTIENTWMETCTTAVQLGSGTAGPSSATLRDCKLAATSKCLDIQAASRTRLDQLVFSADPGQTPTELTINATNAPDGSAVGLSSAQVFDFAASAFPYRWTFTPRYAAIDKLRTISVMTPKAGRYFHPVSAGRGDVDDLPPGVLLAVPWLLYAPISLTRIGADVATAGDAGSKVRLGIYADTGNYAPGALVLDAGQIAGDSATVQELTISQALDPGIYWLAAVGQSITTTRPNIRVPYTYEPPLPIAGDATIPDPSWTVGSYSQTGVTAALPANFTSTLAQNRRVPRIFLKAA